MALSKTPRRARETKSTENRRCLEMGLKGALNKRLNTVNNFIVMETGKDLCSQ